MTLPLFGAGPVRADSLAETLRARHYLGPTSRGVGWVDSFGCLVLASPTSRHLPADWLELTRWCLNGTKNGGTRQWRAVVSWLRDARPDCTTVVSYSDPSAGHTGALYRASGWGWAPTWHRLCPPPTGNGAWTDGEQQEVKDRWIYPLRPDVRRDALRVGPGYLARFPWAEWRESWKRGRLRACGADFARFKFDEVVRRVREVLSTRPDLLRPAYRAKVREGAHALTGHCYVACEAVYHATRGALPMFVRHEGGPHWFLLMGGRVVDPTVEQFQTPPNYSAGRRAAFLTKAPSKRARIVLAEIGRPWSID